MKENGSPTLIVASCIDHLKNIGFVNAEDVTFHYSISERPFSLKSLSILSEKPSFGCQKPFKLIAAGAGFPKILFSLESLNFIISNKTELFSLEQQALFVHF